MSSADPTVPVTPNLLETLMTMTTEAGAAPFDVLDAYEPDERPVANREEVPEWDLLNDPSIPDTDDDIDTDDGAVFVAEALRRFHAIEQAISVDVRIRDLLIDKHRVTVDAWLDRRTSGRRKRADDIRTAIQSRVEAIIAASPAPKTGAITRTLHTPFGTVRVRTAPRWTWPTRVADIASAVTVLVDIDESLVTRSEVVKPDAVAVKKVAQVADDGRVFVEGTYVPCVVAPLVTDMTIDWTEVEG